MNLKKVLRSKIFLPVIALLAIGVVVAVPKFRHAIKIGRMNCCNCNLRQIDGAKQQWAIVNKKVETDVPTENDLKTFIRSSEGFPKCPDGGTYTIGAVNTDPICSIKKHCLPTP